jgi:uncharacterized protein (TIGR02246 family)
MSMLARRVSRTLALLAVLVPAGTALQAQGVPENAAPLEPTTAQLERLRTKYNEAFNKKDAAAVAALYTQNAIVITSDGQVLQGRPAIEQGMRTASADWGQLTSTGLDTRRLGSWGWQVGSTEMKGGPTAEAGRYLAIFGKEQGVWKIRALASVTDTAGTAKLRASR